MAVYKAKDGRAKPFIAKYRDATGKWRTPGFRTEKAAKAAYRKATDEVEKGIHVARAESMTFGDAMDEWLDECRRRHKIGDRMGGNGLLNYERCVENHVRPALGKIKLCDLTALECQDLVNEMASRHKTHQKMGAIVITLTLKYAVERGFPRIILKTPLRVPMKQERVRIPSRAELEMLVRGLETPFYDERHHGHEYRRAMIFLALFAGLRMGEVSGLQWENVNFAAGRIQVHHSRSLVDGLKGPKSNAGIRDVPMHPMVRASLERVAERAGWPKTGDVFVGKVGRVGKPINHEIGETYFFYAMKNAGLLKANGRPVFTFHALRHAFASELIRVGVTAVEVAKLMGHADVTTTLRVYAHVFEDCQRSQEKVLGLDFGFAVQRPCNRIGQPVDRIEG